MVALRRSKKEEEIGCSGPHRVLIQRESGALKKGKTMRMTIANKHEFYALITKVN